MQENYQHLQPINFVVKEEQSKYSVVDIQQDRVVQKFMYYGQALAMSVYWSIYGIEKEMKV